MTQIEMTEDEWANTYRPIYNHYDTNASWGGTMFETYGVEVDTVNAKDYHYVWTYLDGHNGSYVVSGRHFANRIGYFITEVPWTDDVDICITIDEWDDEFECEQCSEPMSEEDYELNFGICDNCKDEE